MAFSLDGQTCIAGAVVWDRETATVCARHVARRPVTFPYVPGLLSFREAPAVLAALRKIRCPVDALICDGQGWAHPRRLGLAAHVGLIADIPTVGCAKSRLIGAYDEPPSRRGAWTPLRDDRAGRDNEIIGAVVRSRAGVKPLFVSVGHRLRLDQAVALILDCAVQYRLPEPTRLADRLVAAEKRRT